MTEDPEGAVEYEVSFSQHVREKLLELASVASEATGDGS